VTGLPSLRRQLLCRLSLLYLVALLASLPVFFFYAWTSRSDDLDQRMQNLVLQLAVATRADQRGALRVMPSSALAQQLAALPSLRYIVIDQRTGAVAEGSSSSLRDDIGQELSSRLVDAEFRFKNADGELERGYLGSIETPEGPVRVLLGRGGFGSADMFAWVQDEIVSELLPILLPLFIGTAIVGPLTIRRSLAPLDRLSLQAAAIEPGRTHIRLDETCVPVEIVPLVRTINKALKRVDEGFDRQRRFTANAAHELRTPLAILRARVDGLAPRESKKRLQRDVDRMTKLVNRLLIVGRSEMHPLRLDAEADLGAVARETIAGFEVLDTASQHRLVLMAPERPVIVRGDAASLEDALRNLIDNALRYSPVGLPIEIEVMFDGAVEVRDHGPGVPREHRERIFEPFWQSADSRAGGVGLGLAIVHDIVERHHGMITVADNRDGGAIFRIGLPCPATQGRSMQQAEPL